MTFKISNFRNRIGWLFALAFIVLVTGVVLADPFGVGALNRLGLSTTKSAHQPKTISTQPHTATPASLAQVSNCRLMSLVEIYVTPSGFSPRTVRVPAGQIVLTVHTCTGAGVPPAYTLTRSDGTVASLEALPNFNSTATLTATSGVLVLTDAKNSKLGKCEINVTP